MENSVLFPMLHRNIEGLPFYITGISVDYNEGGVTRAGGFLDNQWLFCAGGQGELIIDDKGYMIGPNMGFFLRSGIPHQYRPIQKPWITKWVTFNGKSAKDLFDYMNIGDWEAVRLSEPQTIYYIMEDMFKILSSINEDKHIKASSLLYKFLLKVKESKETTSQGDAAKLYKKLQPTIMFMETNYAENISLEDISRESHVNKYYYCKIFKSAYSITPFEYLNKLRIQKSKEALINNPNASIKDISQGAGFNDTSYFCSMFKKIEGCTPIEFKNMYGEGRAEKSSS